MPFPQKGVATGILFGNSKETPEDKLSPSLKVIKESVINFEIPHNLITFDNSLESWAKQGILMINSALTTEVGKVGVHILNWRPFMISLLKRMSMLKPGTIYVLFGSQAKILEPYFNISYLLDYDFDLPYKSSPIDGGKEIFEKLLKNRRIV